MNIPRQYQSIIEQAVASGAFATPEEALRHALELLAKEQSIPGPATPRASRRSNLSARFRQWAESHPPANHFVDDSRESIY
jgi:Arc/MetJ-type ribon-helix-helix transcriptional regulator